MSPDGRRRRILVLNQYYWPGVEATAHLLTELCEALAEDYEVEVVTGVLHGHEDAPREDEHNGVRIVRVSSTSYERSELARRAVNYFSYLGAALTHALRGPAPDLVLCMTDPPIVGDVGVAVGRRFGVPVLVISQDVFPEIATELDRLRNPAVVGVLGGLVGAYLRRADRIVAIGETMRERLEAKGAPPDRLRVIPNWVDTRAITPQPRDNEWAGNHDLVSRFVVMHSGNVGHAQDLDSLVRAATFLRDRDDLRIVIAGFGARHAEMVTLADTLEVDDMVRFLPYQKRERLPLSLSSADVHVVGLAKGLAGYVVPSRLYGILSAGRPVIVAAEDESETARLVREIGCGVVIPAGEARASGAHDPLGCRRRVRPGGDGAAGARLRRGGGGSRRGHGAVSRARPRAPRGVIGKALFWGSLGALAWTHAGYPAAIGVLARLRPRPVRREDVTPSVALVVSAHDEEDVIGRRLENLLALDYPRESLEIVVASDGSEDRTDAIVEEFAVRESQVRLLRCPRNGKVAAQHRAVRETESDVVAFTDANTEWKPDALRKLVRNLADPEVGYVSGQLRLESADGANLEGVYWRYEVWVREQESTASSITAGNGAIYAVRREAYVEDDPKFGHDFGFPYLMEQAGRRAVYDSEAVAVEKPASEPEDEYGRKVRMNARSWGHLLTGRMFRPTRPLYMAELVSHRVLRYSSGALHVALLVSNLALLGRTPFYRRFLALQLGGLGLAAAGRARLPVPGARLAYYYFVVTKATAAGLVRYLRSGTPQTWDKAKGTR